MATQKLSSAGLDFIKGFESFVGYVYDDALPMVKGRYREWQAGAVKGTLTIGYGHTDAAAHPLKIKKGLRITERQAREILDVDLDECEDDVRRLVSKPLTQGQFDALVSFTFNCGAGNLKNIAARINRGNYAEARAALALYVKSDGEFMRGLERRRQGEQALWDQAPPATITKSDIQHPANVDAPDNEGATMAKAKKAAATPVSSSKKANPKSAILPLYRPQQSEAVTRAVLGKHLDLMPAERRGDPVKVLIVRGYFRDTMGKRGKNDRAMYDDAAFIVTPEGVAAFNANSDPAVYRKRVATIKANQAVCYKPGPHGYQSRGGPYPAFRQHEDCIVERDDAGDDFGMHHVNLHKGGVYGTSSLGCLTIPPHQWDEFRDMLTGLLVAHDQETFYVTLLEYAGDEPPVSASEVSIRANPAKITREDVYELGFISAVAVAVSGWWDALTTFVGGLF